MPDPLQNAHNRATAAIDALAREAERLANEHAFALDQLHQEVESLRAINAGLRERLAVLEGAPSKWTPNVGDRVRIARQPFNSFTPSQRWDANWWAKVGRVGVVLGFCNGDADVGAVFGDCHEWIDPSCLELLPDVAPVDTEAT
jgi:hypothetical protein